MFIIEFRLRKGGFFHAEKTEGITQTHCKNGCPDVPESCPDPRSAEKLDAYWRASNYLAACQLYLLDNPLLKEPPGTSPHQKKIVGHWGTVPGQNFIYTHLNRVINRYDLNMIYLSGPGHGGNAMVAQTYLEGPTARSTPTSARTRRG